MKKNTLGNERTYAVYDAGLKQSDFDVIMSLSYEMDFDYLDKEADLKENPDNIKLYNRDQLKEYFDNILREYYANYVPSKYTASAHPVLISSKHPELFSLYNLGYYNKLELSRMFHIPNQSISNHLGWQKRIVFNYLEEKFNLPPIKYVKDHGKKIRKGI